MDKKLYIYVRIEKGDIMENEEDYNEEDYNLEKYFLDQNKEKIYAKKGWGHKDLAYNIMRKTGLIDIYWAYQNYVPPAVFVTYCGYVLIDEAEEKAELDKDDDLFRYKITKFTTIGYCSPLVSKEYFEYLKNTYTNPENVFDDSYELPFVEKKTIDEIIEKAKRRREILEKRNDDWER